jgi:hypothetical protein
MNKASVIQHSALLQYIPVFIKAVINTDAENSVFIEQNLTWRPRCNGEKLLKFGGFSKSHSSIHILWRKKVSMMWCWYWSLCSLEFGFYSVWTQPATSCSIYKSTSRRRRDATHHFQGGCCPASPRMWCYIPWTRTGLRISIVLYENITPKTCALYLLRSVSIYFYPVIKLRAESRTKMHLCVHSKRIHCDVLRLIRCVHSLKTKITADLITLQGVSAQYSIFLTYVTEIWTRYAPPKRRLTNSRHRISHINWSFINTST